MRIVEFSDFQCPFCARIQTSLDKIRARYPDQVAIVYRH
ncbi:MAG: DsbA family protein [Longimicrobiaceae bacterium]